MGCVGKDACNLAGYGVTQAGMAVAIGFCVGGCAADADCAGGEKCDTLTGLCVKAVTPPTKHLGDGCTQAEANASPPPCNCIYNRSGLGFCTEFCQVPAAGAPNTCPTGWFCETQEPLTLSGANDASVTGFTAPNVGLAGFCVPSCGGDAGVTGTDSGACPTNTMCQTNYAGGPGCFP
jgi:hypothetical protein